MRVAVVVPNLNQGDYLGQALDSLFSQIGIDLRVAVVDGGSADDSTAVIGRYEKQLVYWRSRADRGQAAAINEGIEHLEDTEYVSWVNADDLILPGALATMASFVYRPATSREYAHNRFVGEQLSTGIIFKK